MREVKFRGTNGDGTWYIGDFITDHREYNRTCDKAYILPHWDKLNCPISVDPKSIGQYTGLKDKHGSEIYEGDILTDFGDEGPLYVEFSSEHAGFVFVDKYDRNGPASYTPKEISYEYFVVIDNIYENPELLEAN